MDSTNSRLPEWKTEVIYPLRRVEQFLLFTLAFFGCLLCSVAVNLVGICEVPASATIGLLVSLMGARLRLKGNYSLSVYAATFGGMGKISADVNFSASIFFLSIIVALIVLVFLDRIASQHPRLALTGVGGRLGFLGFAGFTVFSALTSGKIENYHPELINSTNIAIVAIAIMLGATTTTFLRTVFAEDNPHYNVIASAITGIVGSAVLVTDYEHARLIAASAFIGSFIGMSTLLDLSGRFIVLSSMVATATFYFASILFFGFGGLLGTVAMVSVLLSRLVRSLVSLLGLKPFILRTARQLQIRTSGMVEWFGMSDLFWLSEGQIASKRRRFQSVSMLLIWQSLVLTSPRRQPATQATFWRRGCLNKTANGPSAAVT